MKASLQWMNQLSNGVLPIDAPDVVTKIGNQIGAVEEVIDLNNRYQGAVIVRVVSSQPLAGSDHLTICQINDNQAVQGVDRSQEGEVQVICGAPNVADGMLTVWLPPGMVVPATADKDPLQLSVRKIMNHVSNGMLASAKELAIGEDHSGIVCLPDDAPVGKSLLDYLQLDDRIVDIENKMFAHRPDLFGQLGLARELSGVYSQTFSSPDWYKADVPLPQADTTTVQLKLDNRIPDDCSRFMTLVIGGIKNGPSPLWLAGWLSRVGIRPVNLIVDITNFVMMVTAQPLHAYDLNKISDGQSAELIIRKAKKDEQLTLLGGKQLQLLERDIVVANAKNPLALGGVMGGAIAEVDSQTESIVLEAANFNMYAIRRTSMSHGLFTDAVTRFTKGQSAWQCQPALALAWQLLTTLQPEVSLLADVADMQSGLRQPESVSVSLAMINEYLGTKLSDDQIKAILASVELNPHIQDNQLHITPPFWRTDLNGAEDVIEEIARLYGIDRLPKQLPKRSLKPADTPPLWNLKTDLRRLASAAGANELYGYSFIDKHLLEIAGVKPEAAYKIANALNPGLAYYRSSLLPSLLSQVHPNHKAGYDRFCVFELGKAHMQGYVDHGGLPQEDERLAVVWSADQKSAEHNYASAPYYQIRFYLDYLLSGLGLDPRAVEYTLLSEAKLEPIWQLAAGCLADQRAASINYGKHHLGLIGEFKPQLRHNLKLPDYCSGLELNVQTLVELLQDRTSPYSQLSQYPKVTQDLTLVRPGKEAYANIKRQLQTTIDKQLPPKTGYDLSLKDVYQPDDKAQMKHWTFRLQFTSYAKTMTDQEVSQLLSRIS